MGNDTGLSPEKLTETDYQHLQKHLEHYFRRKLWLINRQRMIYLGLNGFCLLLFAVVIFVNAQRYHNTVLWIVGFCLLLFGLIEFLELDAQMSGKSLLESLFPHVYKLPPEQENHGCES